MERNGSCGESGSDYSGKEGSDMDYYDSDFMCDEEFSDRSDIDECMRRKFGGDSDDSDYMRRRYDSDDSDRRGRRYDSDDSDRGRGKGGKRGDKKGVRRQQD